MLKWLWLSIIVAVLDQGTKTLASMQLEYAVPLPVMPSFNLTLLHNTGAAFSFLSDAGGWQRWMFIGLAILVTVVIVMWLRKLDARNWVAALALTLVLGGAVGNLIDRLRLGYVVDFVQLYYESWYFAAFNIADSAISVGATLLIIDALFFGSVHKED
ncbi:MAG: signal peptidase II [Gammaproteobacteria bacterium]|nr:MAG: signal peptidase II [Gammaproteobacteria bacterium]